VVSEYERTEWDRRYSEGEYRERANPSPFLDEWLPRLPTGRALDVACGAGRNALRLAEAGYVVEAVDISQVAIDIASTEATGRGLDIAWRLADLDALELDSGRYDLITVFRYINRPLWPSLIRALAPDGFILVEHHLDSPLEVEGPRQPEFRLRPQELLRAFLDLRVVHYSETVEFEGGSTFALARLIACQGDPGW
jgi:SAM-dependent methyltransferase